VPRRVSRGARHPLVLPLVDVVVLDDSQFERVATHWLGAVRTLVPHLWQRQEQTPTPPAVEHGGWTPEDQIGPPNGAYATVSVVFRTWQSKVATHAYSDRSWSWLLGELAGRPLAATVHLDELDEAGRSAETGLTLRVQTEDDVPDQVQLTGGGKQHDPDGCPSDPGYVGRLVTLIEEVATLTEPTFAIVGESPTIGRTRVDVALGRSAQESIGQAREVLRGFSWLTLCPAGLADKLGGPDALRRTGAFAKVTALPDGAVLLQATDSIFDYGPHEAYRVYSVLAPVLPPGVPIHLQGRNPR
jgi:hypothetical protein